MRRAVPRVVAAVILALSALQSAWSQSTLYRSNGSGMLLEPIPSYRRDEYDFVIEVARTGARELRRLFENGEEVSRCEIALGEGGVKKEEKEFSGGIISARRVYGKTGEILLEEAYSEGKLQSVSNYQYADSRLSSVRVTDPDGGLIYSQKYLLSGEGALRRVVRTDADGSTSSSVYFSGSEGVREERNTTAGITIVVRYDERGRTVGRERWEEDQITIREQFVFQSGSDFLESSTETRLPEGTLVESRYDEKGHMRTETVTENQKISERTDYSWDDYGHNTAKRKRSSLGIEEWRYFYDAEGNIAKEDYYLRGALEKTVVYTGKDERYEDFFREGEMFLRAYYSGGTKVREQVYENGTLVRERTF
jgi:hypothetical protein